MDIVAYLSWQNKRKEQHTRLEYHIATMAGALHGAEIHINTSRLVIYDSALLKSEWMNNPKCFLLLLLLYFYWYLEIKCWVYLLILFVVIDLSYVCECIHFLFICAFMYMYIFLKSLLSFSKNKHLIFIFLVSQWKNLIQLKLYSSSYIPFLLYSCYIATGHRGSFILSSFVCLKHTYIVMGHQALK